MAEAFSGLEKRRDIKTGEPANKVETKLGQR